MVASTISHRDTSNDELSGRSSRYHDLFQSTTSHPCLFSLPFYKLCPIPCTNCQTRTYLCYRRKINRFQDWCIRHLPYWYGNRHTLPSATTYFHQSIGLEDSPIAKYIRFRKIYSGRSMSKRRISKLSYLLESCFWTAGLSQSLDTSNRIGASSPGTPFLGLPFVHGEGGTLYGRNPTKFAIDQ